MKIQKIPSNLKAFQLAKTFVCFLSYHLLNMAACVKQIYKKIKYFFFETHMIYFHGAFSNPKTDTKKEFCTNANVFNLSFIICAIFYCK